jgi:pimeloyl-ACP methyl ester carboxylesterase
VLRYDKRGVARSGGNYAAATMRDFASDAAAALSYLTSRPETDHKQIGLIGHSEGGAIAPMLAADNPAVAFMVLLAGPGVPGDALLPQQVRRITLASGGSAAQAAQAAELESKMLAVVKNEKDPSALEKDLRNKFPREFSSAEGPQMISQVRVLASPWFRDFLNYDPASALRKVRCPVLALDGSKDVQVDAEQNLPAIRKALAAGGNKNVEADELPGLNHLFQRATTGSPSEYSQIQETIAPAVLEKISVWIHSAVASSHQH